MTPNTPAGGAVACWIDKRDLVELLDGAKKQTRVFRERFDGDDRPLYTQPPATVSADAVLALVGKWRKDAERLDKSFGPGDMILACGKRADADELEALTRGEG